MAALGSSGGLAWIGTAIEVVFFGLWVCALLLATLCSGFLGWLEILRVRRVFREGWGIVRRPWLFLAGLLCALGVVAISLSVLMQALLQGPGTLIHGWQVPWWVVPLWSGASWGFFHTFSALADAPGQPSWRSATMDPSVGTLLATASYATGRWLERKTWLALAWSPDGTWLASAGKDQQVHLWDVVTGTPLTIYRGHRAHVYTLA